MQTEIVPVAVYPGTATRFYLRALELGPPPNYYFELQSVVIVPPVAEQRDPTTGEILVPATPETEEITVLKNGNALMTEAQWKAWPANSDDDEYQLNALTQNLGLTRA